MTKSYFVQLSANFGSYHRRLHQALECRTPDEVYIGLRNTGLAAAP